MYSILVYLFFFFFFFQAEDGIRDLTVTGVQTCALPILALDIARTHVAVVALQGGDDVGQREAVGRQLLGRWRHQVLLGVAADGVDLGDAGHVARSEEHTSELQSQSNLVCRLLLEKKKKNPTRQRAASTHTGNTLL